MDSFDTWMDTCARPFVRAAMDDGSTFTTMKWMAHRHLYWRPGTPSHITHRPAPRLSFTTHLPNGMCRTAITQDTPPKVEPSLFGPSMSAHQILRLAHLATPFFAGFVPQMQRFITPLPQKCMVYHLRFARTHDEDVTPLLRVGWDKEYPDLLDLPFSRHAQWAAIQHKISQNFCDLA